MGCGPTMFGVLPPLLVPCHKIGVTQWSPKDFDALSISGQQRSPPHSGVGVDSLSVPLETIAHNGPGSCTIPQLCLAHVDSDACIPPQRHLKEVVDRARPVWWRHKESVIQERKKVFSWCQAPPRERKTTTASSRLPALHPHPGRLCEFRQGHPPTCTPSVDHRTTWRKAPRIHLAKTFQHRPT